MPLPEFRAGLNDVSILFISSQRNFHTTQRTDPIFPAVYPKNFTLAGHTVALWYNNNTRAGVLGCVDYKRICDFSGTTCWDNSNFTRASEPPPGQQASEAQNAYQLLVLSLGSSQAYGSIQYRGGSGLNAQSKAGQFTSLPLALEQWKVEAEALFQTSLVRMQITIFDIARGTYANEPGFSDGLLPAYRGICSMVKFKSVGWRNVSFWGFWGILALAFCLVVASRRSNEGVLYIEVFRQKGVRLVKWLANRLSFAIREVRAGWLSLARFLEAHRESWRQSSVVRL